MFPSAEYILSAEIAYRRDRATEQIRNSRVRKARSRRRGQAEHLPGQRQGDAPLLKPTVPASRIA